MKKYISLSAVLSVFLVIAFVLSIGIAQAEDNAYSGTKAGVKAGAKIELKAGTDLEIKNETGSGRMKTNTEEMRKENETIRAEAKVKIEALRSGIKNEKDAAKAKIKETRIVGRENALARFDEAVLRISNLKDRVNALITKFEAKGVDVVNAKSFAATAEVKLAAAKTKIAEINVLLSVSINELSKEDKTKLRTLANETQTLIKEAHLALRDSIKSLKSGVKLKMEADASATTGN